MACLLYSYEFVEGCQNLTVRDPTYIHLLSFLLSLCLFTYFTWFLHIVEVHCQWVYVLARMWLLWVLSYMLSSSFLSATWSLFLFFGGLVYQNITFTTSWVFFILWIASKTTTYFTAWGWQLCISDILRHLAKARFIWLWKCFHAFSATAISCLELWSLFLFSSLLFLSRLVFRIFSSADKILLWTPIACTSLTPLLTDFCSTLPFWNYANTCFFICISMFTDLTALKLFYYLHICILFSFMTDSHFLTFCLIFNPYYLNFLSFASGTVRNF